MFFFFNDTATTEIYTLSLHDALPIYLGGVDDAGRDQILVLVGLGVVAVVQLGRLLHLPDDDRALGTRVLNDDPDWFLERAADDLVCRLLLEKKNPDLLDRLLAPQERYAAARHDALLDRSTR